MCVEERGEKEQSETKEKLWGKKKIMPNLIKVFTKKKNGKDRNHERRGRVEKTTGGGKDRKLKW